MNQGCTSLFRAPARLAAACWFVLCVAAAPLAPDVAVARPITVGSIGDEPAEELKKFLPFARYLAKQLRPEGIDEGKVVVAQNVSQMAPFLREGKVDLYIDSPFPTLAVSRLSGSKLLVRRWKKGVAEYHSVIFGRKDSGISRLEDLKGKLIAFEAPVSSSGYFLPKMVMIQAGLKLVPKKNALDSVNSDEVGYVFTAEDENTMWWVVKGKVAAGAMDDQNYTKEAKGNIDQLKIVHKTFSFPRHIVSYRADLPASLVTRIKQVLTQMDRSEEGKKVLQEFERTTKFDELQPQALASLLQFQKFIDAEIGLK